MDAVIRTHLNQVFSDDKHLRTEAYFALMAVAEQTVDWAYEVWDELVDGLTHKDNHVRAITGQLLPWLAISDPEGRILRDFDKVLAVTHDERTVTARHTLQAMWKIGLAGEAQRKRLVDGFKQRFEDIRGEKNETIFRSDILIGLKNLYDRVSDETIKHTALALIASEPDEKNRKKYAKTWQ